MKKNIVKYTALFIFFFLCLFFFYTINRGDSFVNYGFSYAIVKGEMPYVDFNVVVAPLSMYLYSILLVIYNSIITMFIEQALLLTLFMYFVFKLFEEKGYIVLLLLTIFFPLAFSSIMFPSYNFLLLLELIILIYLEKNNKSDYLIGIVLGLMFCTKQTIGIIIFIPTLYLLIKKKEVFLKRLVGYLIPIGILFVYLIITGSLFKFIDLCFLGLFSFGSSNSYFDLYYLILFILGLLVVIYYIYKDRTNIINYYILLFSFISIPLIDYYHVSLFLLGVSFLIIDNIKINKKYLILNNVLIILNLILVTVVTINFFKPIKFNNYIHLNGMIETKGYLDKVDKVNKYLNKKNVIYLLRGSENYYFKIINDKKISYYDLCNYGNYGYNGIDNLLKRLDNEKRVYFVIDNSIKKNTSNQYIYKFSEFVRNNSKLKKKIDNYYIYYKE